MKNIQSLKGFQDLYGNSMEKYNFILRSFQKITSIYGYKQVQSPILENESLFVKSLGENGEIVSKQMYKFPADPSIWNVLKELNEEVLDKDEESNAKKKLDLSKTKMVVMRPEGTAGIVRCYFENSLKTPRISYQGPMFRYERPQHGRLRQFEQVGVELFNQESPLSDVEVISMAKRYLSFCKIKSNLKLNSLGDGETIEKYNQALKEYFAENQSKLSKLSQHRYQKGAILRILDSKEESDEEVIASAPPISEYYTTYAQERFHQIRETLQDLGLSYEIDQRLVRGLDYYEHTIFEFVPESSSPSSQIASRPSSILGGGRYNTKSFPGVPDCSAIGWAAGVDRLVLSLEKGTVKKRKKILIGVAVARLSEETVREQRKVELTGLSIAEYLRSCLDPNFVTVSFDFEGNLSKQLSRLAVQHNYLSSDEGTGSERVVDVDQENSNKYDVFAVMIWNEDLKNNVVKIKNFDSNIQTEVSFDHLKSYFEEQILKRK